MMLFRYLSEWIIPKKLYFLGKAWTHLPIGQTFFGIRNVDFTKFPRSKSRHAQTLA